MKSKITIGGIASCAIGLLIAICICIYLTVAFSYKERCLPQTVINGVAVDKADVSTVVNKLETQLQHYTLKVYGRDLETRENVELFELTAEDIDLSVAIATEDVKKLIEQQNIFLWPLMMGKQKEYQLSGDVNYNADKFAAYFDGQKSFREDSTVLPKDAYIKGYSEEARSFVMEPEVYGTRMNEEVAIQVIRTAVLEGAESVDLEEKGCYLEPKIYASDEKLQENLIQANKWLDADITYDWNTNEVKLNRDIIQDWIRLQDGVLILDKNAVKLFVEEKAAEYDTYGKSRAFRTTLGYELLLPSGAFGWLTDCEAETKALLELIETGTVCNREPIYACKAPWKGMNDIGNSYVEADLTHQHLYLYQNGNLVLETDFVSGDMSKNYNTPEGVFGITYKTTNAILRGGDYAEHVSYWMPYHGNYGMHDATWRTEFGGDIYQDNGSHGCINLPLEKAGEIYQYISEGFPVICYYYPPGVLPEPESYDSDDEDD